MTWYGQRETDKHIAKYFEELKTGTCIEVGVSDGKRGSNTLHFEEKGWRAICIDPIPQHVEEARKIRKEVLEVACGSSLGRQNLYVFDIGERNILSSLSGLEPDPKLLVSHGHLINKCYNIEVDVKPLDRIIRILDLDHIDFISIDTEGTELDVLRGLELTGMNYTIDLLVVENNHDEPDHANYLTCFGWTKVKRHFVNDFYVREEHLDG